MPRRWLKYGLLTLCLLMQAGVFAKEFPIVHFVVENGLPSNTVYDIYRDSEGFLWLATDKGVVKYNGNEFETLTAREGLPDNDVFFFNEDRERRLWMSCYNGELCFIKDGVVHNAGNTPYLVERQPHSFAKKLAQQYDGSINIVFNNSSFILNTRGARTQKIRLPATLPESDPYNAPLWTKKVAANRYWLFFSNHSLLIDTNANVIQRGVYRNSQVYQYAVDQDQGYFWTDKALFDVNEAPLFTFENKALTSSFIYKVARFAGNWYICTDKGLFINNTLQLLPGTRVSGVSCDVEGNIWICTLGEGIYELPRNYAATEQINNVYTGGVKFAKVSGDTVYFATYNSNLYRLVNGQKKLLVDYENRFRRHYSQSEWANFIRSGVPGSSIDTAFRYFDFSPSLGVVAKKINGDHSVVRSLRMPNSFPQNVKEVVVKGDSVYLRDFNMITVGKADDTATTLSVAEISQHDRQKRILAMCFAPDNSLWYSTLQEVVRISGGGAVTQKQFKETPFRSMCIAGNYLVGISNKNQLFIACNYQKNIQDTVYTDPINCIWNKLYQLDDSTFLISTDNQYRLLHLFAATGRPAFKVQTIENRALPVQAEYICSGARTCYFFKNGAITSVPIADLFVVHQSPKIIFKALRTRDSVYKILQDSAVRLQYREAKNITISFAPFSFGSRNIICEYSISKDTGAYWRQVKNNEINLFDPGYGDYHLKVRAKLVSNESFGVPYVFNFTISKPFWAEWWFVLLMVAVFAAMVVFVGRGIALRRSRKRELLHQNEIKFLRSEYKALNALMNPHFIFNTLNNVQWLVNNGDKMAANHYLRIFSDLVRQNMVNISKELIPLNAEIELVRNYLKLEKLRFKDALNYEINIQEGIDLDNIKIPPLLIQPLVENAIKHGLLPGVNTSNLLTISIYSRDDMLFVDIVDNGIGINESQKKSRRLHESTGIENIRKRIEKLSRMHDIHIILQITEIQDVHARPEGTLARIGIDIRE